MWELPSYFRCHKNNFAVDDLKRSEMQATSSDTNDKYHNNKAALLATRWQTLSKDRIILTEWTMKDMSYLRKSRRQMHYAKSRAASIGKKMQIISLGCNLKK
jgi:hypothetical protein